RGDVHILVNADWRNVPPATPERVSQSAIGTDTADVALPAGHPLATHARLSLSELTEEVWISSTVGSICYDWLTKTLRNAGHEPRIAHQAAEFPTQLALVAAGLGVAMMPRLARDLIPPGVRL